MIKLIKRFFLGTPESEVKTFSKAENDYLRKRISDLQAERYMLKLQVKALKKQLQITGQ
jgi:hypothetical protein